MKTNGILLTLIAFLAPLISSAQVGQLDPEFSGDGFLMVSFYADQHAFSDHVLVLKDSSLLITGTARVPTDSSVAVLLKYFPDGSPDLNFDGDGKYFISLPNNNAYGTASLQQPDGKIVTLVGLYNDQDSIGLFRFNVDGTRDMSFSLDGVATLNLGFPYQDAVALARQSDGKYLIAGNADDPIENSKSFLARLMPDGKRDLSFDSDGIVFSSIGSSNSRFDVILPLPNGKIIAGGYAIFDGKENFVIARYTSSGQLDTSFDGDGIKQVYFENSDSRALGGMLLPDGRMMFCGYANLGVDNGEFAAVRLTSDGKLDPTFDGDGLVTIDPSIYHDQVRCLVRQPDGKIILGGYVHSDGPLGADICIMRLLDNGSLDNSFDGDGLTIFPAIPDNSDGINSMALQPDGKIVVTGDARNGPFGEIVTARFLTGLTSATSDKPEIIQLVSVYPNPVSDHLVINYTLDKKERIAIQFLNLEGKIMETLMPPASKEKGSHVETFSLHQSYPAGHYLVNISTPEGARAEQVTIN